DLLGDHAIFRYHTIIPLAAPAPLSLFMFLVSIHFILRVSDSPLSGPDGHCLKSVGALTLSTSRHYGKLSPCITGTIASKTDERNGSPSSEKQQPAEHDQQSR